jgi:amino acid adenylation domain-containing protein
MKVNPIEADLTQVIKNLFQIENIPSDQNFRDVGLTETHLTRVISDIGSSYSLELDKLNISKIANLRDLSGIIIGELLATNQIKSKLEFTVIPKANRKEQLPLSFAQERLWLVDRLDPETTSYTLPSLYRLTGELDLKVFENSILEIIKHHEILRTNIKEENGKPFQVINSESKWELSFRDYSNIQNSFEAAISNIELECIVPFRLSEDSLIRTSVYKLGCRDHLVFFNRHHIVSDAWSNSIFLRELIGNYCCSLSGKNSAQQQFPVQYADFAAWERSFVDEQSLRVGLNYWKSKLSGIQELAIPTDKKNSKSGSRLAKTHAFHLNEDITERVREIASKHKVSPFIFLFAVLKVMLAKYTGQEDICIGIPVANRLRPEIEPLIGFFVNTLPIRSEVCMQKSFKEFLYFVREVVYEAFSHQNIPFEKIVKEVNPHRDIPDSPLFRIMFTFYKYEGETSTLPGITIKTLDIGTREAKYDLIFCLSEEKTTLEGCIEYRTDIFEKKTIQRLDSQFQVLLGNILNNPDTNLYQLEMVKIDEKRKLLNDWSRSNQVGIPGKTVHQLFEEHADRIPERVAIKINNSELTYAELDNRANQLAHFIREKLQSSGNYVGVCIDRSFELIIVMLGILKSGNAYVPLDPSYPEDRLSIMIEATKMSLILTCKSSDFSAINLPVNILQIDNNRIEQKPKGKLSINCTNEDIANLMYTSGTTGKPKCIPVTHKGIVRVVSSSELDFISEDEVLLQFAPISFDASTFEIWGALCNGATLILCPPGSKSLNELSTIISENNISVLWLTAGLFHAFIDEHIEGLINVKYIIAGGDVLSSTHVHKLQQALKHEDARIINGYGPTESTIFTCLYTIKKDTPLRDRIPIGKPIASTSVYIVDKNIKICPIGSKGELVIGGDGLCKGYLGDDILTKEKFIDNPFHPEGHGTLYRSGDLVRYLDDGNIEFLGRIDNQVKVRGFRVELDEVESLLRNLSEVQDCAATILRDKNEDARIVAFCVCQDEKLNALRIRNQLSGKVPHFLIPSNIRIVSSLPLSPNGKVDRKRLLDMAHEFETAIVSQEPITEHEKALAAIWKNILSMESIGIHDNFFELGGDSISATRAISRINKHFIVELNLRTLFEYPTIFQLSQIIREQKNTEENVNRIMKADKHKRIPLSYSQERLWFFEKYEPGNSVYNIRLAFKVRGLIDYAAVETAFKTVIQRHEILRTTILQDGKNKAYQKVNVIENVSIPIIDYSYLNEDESEKVIKADIEMNCEIPFDISKDMLIRMMLFKASIKTHILVIITHHLVFDGWSTSILLNEFSEAYNATVMNRELRLHRLENQYCDYAVWQRAELNGIALKKEADYWQKNLTNVGVCEFPTDFFRPPRKKYNGAGVKFEFEVDSRLNRLSEAHGATHFMIFLAALKILLSKYSGEEDICIGSIVAGRVLPELEPLIGYFANTLAIRSDLRGNPTINEIIQRVKASTIGAFENQLIAFERVIELVQPKRDLSRTPIFQVGIVYNNVPESSIVVHGLEVSPFAVTQRTSKFDMLFGLRNSGNKIIGEIEFNTDIYSRSTIERISRNYCTLIKAFAGNSQTRLYDVEVMDDQEKRLILNEWNATNHEFAQHCTVGQLFERQTSLTPSNIAIQSENGTYSYTELNSRANKVARHLRAKGLNTGDIVIVMLDRSIEMISILLGILKAGAAYVPIDIKCPIDRLTFIKHDAAAKYGITTTAFIDCIGQLGQWTLCLDRDWDAIALQDDSNLGVAMGEHDLAYILYTSGSTGKPKGVMIEHAQIVNSLLWEKALFELGDNDAILQRTTYTFDVSIWEIFGPLICGSRVVLADPTRDYDPVYLMRLIQTYEITTVLSTPSLIMQLISDCQFKKPARLKRIISTAEPLSYSQYRKYLQATDIPLFNLYGPTECAVEVSHIDLSTWNSTAILPIGKPGYNTQFYILDENMNPVPIGAVGELHIGGAQLARGYRNLDDLTMSRFVQNPFTPHSNSRLYKSGDFAKYLSDGNVVLIGRIDNQVKIRGYRVELGEVESQIRNIPHVKECAVVRKEDQQGNSSLIAYINYSQPEFDVDLIRKTLIQWLPSYMVPSIFVELDVFPLTTSGKLDRNALSNRKLPKVKNEECVKPENAIEAEILDIWSQILDNELLGVTDNFFEHGGHSLLVLSAISEMNEKFGTDLSAKDLFKNPTVREAAEAIQARTASANNIIVPLKKNADGIPLFFVPGAGGNVDYLYRLSYYLGNEQPMYGFQAPGLDEVSVPLKSLEEYTSKYIAAIKTVQPTGPYLIAGHSFGGHPAFEIARTMMGQGDDVALLALVESFAPGEEFLRYMEIKKNQSDFDLILVLSMLEESEARRKHIQSNFDRKHFLSLDEEVRYEYVLEYLNQIGIKNLTKGHLKRYLLVQRTNEAMDIRNRGLYRGEVLVIGGNELNTHFTYENKCMGWDQFCERTPYLSILPGDHNTILREPYVAAVADSLRTQILRALHDRCI